MRFAPFDITRRRRVLCLLVVSCVLSIYSVIQTGFQWGTLPTRGFWAFGMLSAIVASGACISGAAVLLERARRQRRGYVFQAPGYWLWSLAAFWCSRKTCDRILSPILADMHAEHYEALKEGRRGKAAIARIRGCLAFWKAVGLHTVLKTMGEVWRAVKGA